MDESEKKIFSDSNKIITKLQLLSTFFEEEVIYKIYVRSQVIHKLFENNPEIDSNKLSLFHLQFTESVVELLRRIKKTNEKNAILILDEIALNEELIENLKNSLRTEVSIDEEQKRHTTKVNLSLKNLYNNLSDLSTDFPFKNTGKFAPMFAKDYFTEISPELFEELTVFDPEKVYLNAFAIIDKKLMGLQCRNLFNNEFYLGLKSGGRFLEVFKVIEDVEADFYFTFDPALNRFLICDFEKIKNIEPIQTTSKKEKLIQELQAKNRELSYNIEIIESKIPPEVKKLLEEYYDKIKDMDFLDFIDNLDVQTNILKVMLDTKTM